MPTPPAKARRLIVDGQKTEIAPLTDVGRATFPGGPRADLPPSLPSTEPRRRGRPRENMPTGDWVDSDYLARRVATIVGHGDEREETAAERLPLLRRLATRILRRKLTDKERSLLRTLLISERAPASVITRMLYAWRHGLGERDVRRMLKSLRQPVERDHAALVLEYEAERLLLDDDGQPVIDDNGRPIRYRPPVCDEHGQPILHRQSRRVVAVRPRVKLIRR